MDTDLGLIRVHPCASVVKRIQAPPSLTHYGGPGFAVARNSIINSQATLSGHRAFPRGSSGVKSVIPGSWTTDHRPSGSYAFIMAAFFAVFSPKLR